MPIIKNSKNKSVVIRAANTETVSVADSEKDSESLAGLGITRVFWTGDWTVARGSNTILNLSGQDHWDLTGWASLTEDMAADIVITAGSTAGTIILECKKYNDANTGEQ